MNFFQQQILLVGVLPGALFILMGLTFIAVPDWYWKMTEWRHKAVGLATTGKPAGWNGRLLLAGLFSFVCGLGFVLYAIYHAATFKLF